MAVGDDAAAAGFSTVPDSGEEGKVKYGAREINRTRDYVAQVKALLPGGKITIGTAAPVNANGSDGDIYFRIV